MLVPLVGNSLRYMTRLTLLFFLLLFSCRYKYPAGLEVAGKDTVVVSPVMPTVERQDDNEEDFSDSSEYQEESFLLVKDYPLIKDSVQFIKQLRSNCHINKHTRFIDITAFMKIKYGPNFAWLNMKSYTSRCLFFIFLAIMLIISTILMQ